MAAAAPVSALRDTVAAANGIQAAAPMSPSVHDSQGGAAAPGLDSTADWTPRKPPKFLPEAFLRCTQHVVYQTPCVYVLSVNGPPPI